MLIEEFGLDSDFIKSALDEEESSRVEREDTQTLIIIDTAVSEIEKNDTLVFYTMPMSIIIKDQLVLHGFIVRNQNDSAFPQRQNR